MELATRTFGPEELAEVFPRPPLREVAFEVRFSPRLRISAEIWKLQDKLVGIYPSVGKENPIQANGTILDVSVFQNPADFRVIKVTAQSFLIAFTRYSNFEEFKKEVLDRTTEFCSSFGIRSFTRVGLRYVNEILLEGSDPASLLRLVRPVLNFDRFPIDFVNQFAVEMRTHYKEHLMTLRSALIPGNPSTYVLDIDSHLTHAVSIEQYPNLLDEFHDSAQRIFLDHITEECKSRMRSQE